MFLDYMLVKVRLVFTALAGVVIQPQALLAEVNKTHELGLLEAKQIDALRLLDANDPDFNIGRIR